MSENVTSQETISKSQVEAAIQAVRDRGWDVNPYTVAEEAQLSHTDVSRNPELMQLIINARGGDVSFQKVEIDHSARVGELEEEIRTLRERLESTTGEIAMKPPDDDVLNEQVKALLSSESDEQVKQLEKELEQAYAQVVSLEEDKVDLTRSVTGLEKVNEAINARLRELEADAVNLRKQAEAASLGGRGKEEMEQINREMALRMEELVASNRANNEHIALLEATNTQHESLIMELEAKLAELQQEADMLALQLQNAFNIGYQKGLSDSKPQGDQGQGAPQTDAVQAPSAVEHMQQAPVAQEAHAMHEQQDFSGAPTQTTTGDQVVYTPGQYYEMHQQMPNVEIRHNEGQPEETPEQHVTGWGPDADKVLNFARTGPYVASTFNPLESLSWRDLETVYSMGVLSVKDLSKNLTDYQQGSGEGDEQVPVDQGGGHPPYEEPLQETYQQFPAEEAEAPEPPKSDGALDFIDDLIDIDKLDIFESLEELEELGNIDVLSEPLSIDFDQPGESTGETAPVDAQGVSDSELRDLINSRISASKEHKGESQEVRAMTGSDSADDGKPLPGLKNKFVGGKGGDAPAPAPSTASSTTTPILAKHVPPDVRKACGILGVRPEELTKEIVNKEWKRQIAAVHPDLQGGDNESSIYLNTAKDTLLRWLDQSAPKLGGKFGAKSGGAGSSPFTGKNKPDDKS